MASCCLWGWVTRLVIFLKSLRLYNCPTSGAASSQPSHGSQEPGDARRGEENCTSRTPSLRSDDFWGFLLVSYQLHSGCSGVNKRYILYLSHPSFSIGIFKNSENSDRKNLLNVHTFGVVLSINSIKTAIPLSRGANNSYQLNATDNGFEARCCSVSRWLLQIFLSHFVRRDEILISFSLFPIIGVMVKLFTIR